ncbi:hypothetical protein MTR_8g468220 [Medicago truncatula]|uniref:Uncharacterized protein n=1 Tax=Medicago truncatula TaxID=3880 RepID=A0A072TRD8_MEDTR|nr:hypothetical protein MTR_8g468220 [Medicago truncatula]
MNYLLDLYICHKMYSNSGPICRKLAMTVPRSSGRNSGNVGCKWTYYMVGKRTNENSSGRVLSLYDAGFEFFFLLQSLRLALLGLLREYRY